MSEAEFDDTFAGFVRRQNVGERHRPYFQRLMRRVEVDVMIAGIGLHFIGSFEDRIPTRALAVVSVHRLLGRPVDGEKADVQIRSCYEKQQTDQNAR